MMSTGTGLCGSSRTLPRRSGPGTRPWITTIVDLDTGQVLGIVDGRDHKGVGDWLFARPLKWRLGVQVVAIDPSAAVPEGAADVDVVAAPRCRHKTAPSASTPHAIFEEPIAGLS